jgi:hypothetical protein
MSPAGKVPVTNKTPVKKIIAVTMLCITAVGLTPSTLIVVISNAAEMLTVTQLR